MSEEDKYECISCNQLKPLSEYAKREQKPKFLEADIPIMVCKQCKLNNGGKKGKAREQRYWNPSIKIKQCSSTKGCGKMKRTSSFHWDRGRPKHICKDCEKKKFRNYFYQLGGDKKQYNVRYVEPLRRLQRLMKLNYAKNTFKS